MDKQREQFEEWAEGEGYRITMDGDKYASSQTDFLWMAWQAAQKAAVPDGWQLVPMKPTEDMLTNVDEYVGGSCYSCSQDKASRYDCLKVWTSMIEAAPKP